MGVFLQKWEKCLYPTMLLMYRKVRTSLNAVLINKLILLLIVGPLKQACSCFRHCQASQRPLVHSFCIIQLITVINILRRKDKGHCTPLAGTKQTPTWWTQRSISSYRATALMETKIEAGNNEQTAASNKLDCCFVSVSCLTKQEILVA